MAKIDLETTNAGYQSSSSLKRNFEAIEDEFQDKVLYRNNPEGEENQMENNLDMNSFRILNLPIGTTVGEPLTVGQIETVLGLISDPDNNPSFIGTVQAIYTATGSEVGNAVTIPGGIEYTPGSGNLSVYMNGVRQYPTEYVETSTTVVTFNEPLTNGMEVLFVINEYTGGSFVLTGLNDLGDVILTSPTNGQVLTYNTTLGVWENQTSAAGVTEMDDLSDVTLTSEANFEHLRYNTGTNQWVNDKDYVELHTVLTGTTPAMDCSLGNSFSITLSGDTTFTFTNPPSSGLTIGCILRVVQDSTPRTITWPASVKWAGGTPPTLSTGSGDVDVFVFFTHDGGTNWYGFISGQDMS